MHVHLIGVCGTGMGALARLFLDRGHRVTGSDRAFYPPMGPALRDWGVELMEGWNPENLEPAPDLVIVGNVCRPNNEEARAAIERGLRYLSFPGAMEEIFLADRQSYVVAGTHGKTTTTSILSHLLAEAGLQPGYMIGGIPIGRETSAVLGKAGGPFVIEGDEYDCAFFEKYPKCWRYRPWACILTSVEHDHIDIYPDEQSYHDAFAGFIERIPEDGILLAWAGDPWVRRLADKARCRVRYYALESDDCGDASVVWQASVVKAQAGAQPFDLFIGGTFCGRIASPLFGDHNIRNVVAALALAAEAAEVPVRSLISAIQSFRGIRRRQELIGEVQGIHVYDDFAHHPTAVRETIRSIRMRHSSGRIIAAFEPRSATASRRLHQAEYPAAFAGADYSFIAPVGRPEIGEEERLDVAAITSEITALGAHGEAPASLELLVERIVEVTEPGDSVLLMSNGSFGGIHDEVLAALALTKGD